MRKTLKTLPSNLTDAFQSSLERIEAQSPFRRNLAHRLVGWITHSQRLLKTAEIRHALSLEEMSYEIEEIDDEIYEEYLTPVSLLLEVCVGLVIVNVEDDTVRMVHTSAHEFFGARESVTTHENMAKTCLLYLSFGKMATGPCQNVDEMAERFRQMPFLSYAARHWGIHIQGTEMERNLAVPINKLLDNAELRSSSFQALQYHEGIKDPDLTTALFETLSKGHQPLHLAAYWNLTSTTQYLLARGEKTSSVDSQGWSPLHWACSFGHLATARILISGGADINAKDLHDWTPLFWAASKGHLAVVKALLESLANHTIKDGDGWTALDWAVSRSHQEVVEALLEYHQNFTRDSQQRPKVPLKSLSFDQVKEYKTSIELKPRQGDITIFDMLTADQSILTKEYFRKALKDHYEPPTSKQWRNLDKGYRKPGYYILRPDAVPEPSKPEPDIWKSRFLHVAIKDGNLLATLLLIELGADVNYYISRPPLHTAAFREDPRFVEALLRNGADMSLTDEDGLTALHLAVFNTLEETTLALLKGGANVNAVPGRENPSASGKTPLMLACEPTRGARETAVGGRREEVENQEKVDTQHQSNIVRLLLSRNADVSLKDVYGRTAVHYAAEACNLNILQQLLDAGADFTVIDHLGRNAIHCFAAGDWGRALEAENPNQILQLFIQHCGPDAQNALSNGSFEHPHTPMSLAMKFQRWNTFEALWASGAIVPPSFDFRIFLSDAVRELQPLAVRYLVQQGISLKPGDLNSIFGRVHLDKWYADQPGISHTLDHVIPIFDQVPLEKSPSFLEKISSILKDLLTVGLDLNETQYNRTTFFLRVVEELDFRELVQQLLDIGFDPYHTNEDGHDSFLLAALSGNFETLHCLLDHAIERPKEGHWTQRLPDTKSAGNGKLVEIIWTCLKQCNLVEVRKFGQILLQRAKENWNNEMVKQLVVHGADVEISDHWGWTPLHFAAYHGNEEVAQNLLEAGANVCAVTKEWNPSIPRILGTRGFVEWTGHPLHIATMMGQKSVAKLLLINGADVNANTGIDGLKYPGLGPTALRIALDPFVLEQGETMVRGEGLDDDRLSIAQMLIEHGANLQGAANHFYLSDVLRFEKYQELWDALREGISNEGHSVSESTPPPCKVTKRARSSSQLLSTPRMRLAMVDSESVVRVEDSLIRYRTD